MAALGTAEKFIEIANNEIGYIEGPKENQTKYGEFTKVNFQPWCGSFVMWCANKAGVKVPNTVLTSAGAAAFQKSKKWHEENPQPGDLAYFDFPGDGVNRISHVGIVVKNNGDGTVVTIEGNTSGNSSGDQRNGGEVAKKVRAFRKNSKGISVTIVGFGRPDYQKAILPKPVKEKDPADYPGRPIEPGEVAPYIKRIQKALKVKPVDGIYGPQTKKAIVAWQKDHPKMGEPNGIVNEKAFKKIVGE